MSGPQQRTPSDSDWRDVTWSSAVVFNDSGARDSGQADTYRHPFEELKSLFISFKEFHDVF